MKRMTNIDNEEMKTWHTEQGKSAHFTMPEGYFESLNDRIMAGIDALPSTEELEARPQKYSWWTKAKPSLYLAASFVGLFFAFKGVMMYQDYRAAEVAQTEQQEDAYTRYYEDYAHRLVDNEVEHELDLVQYM